MHSGDVVRIYDEICNGEQGGDPAEQIHSKGKGPGTGRRLVYIVFIYKLSIFILANVTLLVAREGLGCHPVDLEKVR